MPLIALNRLRQKPSPELRAALNAYSQGDDDQILWDIGDGGENFFRSYELIRAAGNELLNPKVGVLDDPKVYPEDRKHILGYVAESLDGIWLRNPAEDFRYPPLGPCQCGLKDDVEMDLQERPKGLFVCVAGEYIVHDDWLAYFASPSVEGVKTVRYRGRLLSHWNRLRVRHRHQVIDNLGCVWKRCGLCRQPIITCFGDLWFSATGEVVLETQMNKQGHMHYGEGQIIIVSAEALSRFRKVHRLQRAGLRPLAVYSKATRRYEVLARIQKAIAHIAAEELENLQKAPEPPTMSQEQMQMLKGLWQFFSGGDAGEGRG